MAEDRDRDRRPLDKDSYVHVRVIEYIPIRMAYYLPDRTEPVYTMEIVQADLN